MFQKGKEVKKNKYSKEGKTTDQVKKECTNSNES